MKNTIRAILIFCIMAAGVCFMQNEVEAKDADGDIVIVIDPGHGGDDPGAIGTTGIYERTCTYATALAIKEELETYDGVKVYLTRGENEWISNTARAMVARELNADFLISVHYNSGVDTARGCIAYASVNELYSQATTLMGKLITDKMSAVTGIPNGGVQTRTDSDFAYEDYYTIMGEGVRVGVPSIIVEHLFLSNTEDVAVVSDENGNMRADMIKAIGVSDATAIAEYFSLSKGEGSSQTGSKEAIAIVGVLDPTFYYSNEEFQNINLNDAYGVVIYSDGTAQNVKLDSIGQADYSITGPQDIAITYNNLSGYLRVINRNESYLPEVTLPQETEAPTQEETTSDVEGEETTTVTQATTTSDDTVDNIKNILKYVIIIVVVLIIATIIIIIESKRRNRRGRRRRRR